MTEIKKRKQTNQQTTQNQLDYNKQNKTEINYIYIYIQNIEEEIT